MTTTYYAPRPRPADPRAPRPDHRAAADGDVRETLGIDLPTGYSWARRAALTVVHGGDPTEPGPDERQARARLLKAISRWGAA
ncbi:hypothetical protein OHU11_29965 [Streptomyces sp. NBC_00257]|uniref:hypothetical protein n=1 Tax=unclassified Streptomyces TaxID=2593676 RepID=UPI00224E4878|nr:MULTISPECIES: hypothetical protein [unclassified Streptomyces]MCX5431878.1 hypothetical protein [Streptomyces sp. NBC_00062]